MILSYRDYNEGLSDFRMTSRGEIVYMNIYVNSHPEIKTMNDFQIFTMSDPLRISNKSINSAHMDYLNFF